MLGPAAASSDWPRAIVATASHCTPDRQTYRRSVCEPFQLLRYLWRRCRSRVKTRKMGRSRS